jgi:hypothetical protein
MSLPRPLPPDIAKTVDGGQLYKLQKALYGLTEAPRQWFLAYRMELIKIGFVPCQLLPAVFYYRENGQLLIVLALHVDDGLMTVCPKESPRVLARCKAKFEYSTWDTDNFRFTGRHISRGSNKEVIIDMDQYIENIDELDFPKDRARQKGSAITAAERTSLRGKLGELG